MSRLGLLRQCRALLCASCGNHNHHHPTPTPSPSTPSISPPTPSILTPSPSTVIPSSSKSSVGGGVQRLPSARVVPTKPTLRPSRAASCSNGSPFDNNFKGEIPEYDQLLQNNRDWVRKRNTLDPEYFRWLSQGQSPPFLYIGCSDSRMALNEMVGCKPGAMFVHRNIANQVSVTDMGLLAVLSYAIENLKVDHIIVCGHYECGGVKAAVSMETDNSLVANWVNPIKRVYIDHKVELQEIEDEKSRLNRLTELNVIQQVHNLCQTSAVRAAFRKRRYPQLHGWVVDINSGLVLEMPLPLERWIEQGYLPDTYIHRFPQPPHCPINPVNRASPAAKWK